jgi:uncharacterized protein DUF4058
MPSPFPGMNPYLEQNDIWQDFHDRFVPALGDELAALVSPHFIVKIEEHLFIHEVESDADEYIGNADINASVTHKPESMSTGVITSPMMARVPIMQLERQPYLEIRDRRDQVLAIIEVLSPSNKKSGPFRRQFIYKRNQVLATWASYVEIDLLRGGERMPLEPPPVTDYCVLVSRYEDRPDIGFWPIALRDPLPTIPIPLPEPVSNAKIDLQKVLNTVYDRAHYKDHLYRGKPNPPLSAGDAAWAQSLIAVQV